MKTYSFKSVQQIEGERLLLKPLRNEDLPILAGALVSPTTWFSKTRGLDNENKFVSYFEPMITRHQKDEALTLIAVLKETGEFVAMSTYQHPSASFRKVEIGFTWISEKWQRTFVNTEMKYLMLKHAFEQMKTNRVEFSVHPENKKSNLAVQRIGATFEGTLRKWRFLPGPFPDDGNRNLYSIIDDEWPTIAVNLMKRLN